MSTRVSKTPGGETYRTELEQRLLSVGVASVELGHWTDKNGDYFVMLVDDSDAQAARSKTRRLEGTFIHFMTSSGGKRGSFRLDNPTYSAITLAIFPFDLSQNLLKKSAKGGGLDALDRFNIAAYIEAYFGSLPRLVGLTGGTPSVSLGKLADVAGVDPSHGQDRAALERYFVSIGWRPAVDKLERLGLADPWIVEHILSGLVGHRDIQAGLSVFFCRSRAVELGFLDDMRIAIERSGFELLQSLPLDGEVANLIYASTRGGNWGAGPFPMNGGPPVHLLFAVDVFPITPAASKLTQHPFLDNDRTLSAKNAARDAVFRDLPAKERFNPMHSSDNSAEALRIAEGVLSKSDFAGLSQLFETRMKDIQAVHGSGEFLESKNKIAACVEIQGETGRRIRKIYRPQYANFAELTVRALDTLSPTWPEFPTIREHRHGYIEFDAPDGEFTPLSEWNKPLPVKAALRLRKVLRRLLAEGFKPIRWEPRSGVCYNARKGTLLLPGFEEMVQYDQSVELSDLVPGRARDPEDASHYGEGWFPYVGVPRRMFLQFGRVPIYLYRWFLFPFAVVSADLLLALRRIKKSLTGQAKSIVKLILRRQ